MLVEVQVVIGTVHSVLVEADSLAAAEDVVADWDTAGTYPAAFVAVAYGETLDRVITVAVDVDAANVQEYAAEWADDNYGEVVRATVAD